MEMQQTLSIVDDPQSALVQRSKYTNTVGSAMHQSLQWTITPKCGGSFTHLFQLQQTSLISGGALQPGLELALDLDTWSTNPRAPHFLADHVLPCHRFCWWIGWQVWTDLNQTFVVIKSSNHQIISNLVFFHLLSILSLIFVSKKVKKPHQIQPQATFPRWVPPARRQDPGGFVGRRLRRLRQVLGRHEGQLLASLHRG